jgi:hypothetical protein
MLPTNLNRLQLIALVLTRNACWPIQKNGSSGSRVLLSVVEGNWRREGKIWPSPAYILLCGNLWIEQTFSSGHAAQNSGDILMLTAANFDWCNSTKTEQPPPLSSHIHRGVLVLPMTTKQHGRVSLNIRISYFTVISQSQHQSFHFRYIDLSNTHNVPCFKKVSSVKTPFYTSDIV